MSKVFLKKWLLKKMKEEVDKEQREANLIMYWAKERNKNSEERQNEDKKIIWCSLEWHSRNRACEN